jgi:hypothetical protein
VDGLFGRPRTEAVANPFNVDSSFDERFIKRKVGLAAADYDQCAHVIERHLSLREDVAHEQFTGTEADRFHMAHELNAKLVETPEVKVALVLMHTLAERGRAAGESHFVACRGEHLSSYETCPIAAPLPDDDRTFDLRAVEQRPAVEQL